MTYKNLDDDYEFDEDSGHLDFEEEDQEIMRLVDSYDDETYWR